MSGINQTAPVSDEELDQMILKLERDGMTPKMLSLMRELREVRRGYLMQFTKEQRDILIKTAEYMANRENTSDYSENIRKVAEIALAVLQSSGNFEQPEPVSNRDESQATQFKPLADLYGITSPTGSETSFTFDANEAANFIEGGWSVQEYVELERYQEAMIDNLRENVNSSTNNCREITETSTNEHVRREYRASDEQVVLREYRTNHSVWIQCSKQAYESRKGEGCEVRELYERPQAGNSPANPDGWIPVSERMPDRDYVLAADISGAYYPPHLPNTQVGIYADWFGDGKPSWDDGDGNDLHLKQVTHWMPLPAAPKEVG